MNPGTQVHPLYKCIRWMIERRYSAHDFWRFYARVQTPAAELKSLHNCGAGQRCFILGGGPSLKKCEPGPLATEVTFGVNSIFLIEEWLGFLPSYYVVEDNLVVEDRKEEIGAMVGPHKFYSKFYRDQIVDCGRRTLLNVIYDYSDYKDFPVFSQNAAKAIWVGGTVTYLCLQLAFYMGFDPVILIGMDHSYSTPSDILKTGAEWTSQSDDPNHFHPDYFGKGKRWHNPRVDRMELAYVRAREVFESQGRRVLNATVGGQLEIFPRVEYSTLFDNERVPNE